LFAVVSIEDHLAQLIETLDIELEQLTILRFRLVVLASLVAADQTVWLPASVRELEATTEQLRLIDLRRAAATSGITEAFWLDPEARLTEIAAKVDDAWGEMLHDRRREILEQVAGIHHVAELAISAMGRRSALITEALSFVSSDSGSTYGRQSRSTARIVQGAM
jgi:cell division protein ZapA (FtsZ GTPase activity inhibitor)